jgi:hypothetical protein
MLKDEDANGNKKSTPGGFECRSIGNFYVFFVDGDWRGEYGLGIDQVVNGIQKKKGGK